MFSLQIFGFALLLCVQNIQCLRKVYCEPTDELCLTNAVNERVFPKLVAGMPGIDSIDPMHFAIMPVHLPTLKYTLYNVTVTGMKDCVIHVKRNAADTKFEYRPCCPRLTLESEYDAEGTLDALPVKGRGIVKLIYEKYNLKIEGNQKKVEYADCKQHIRILDYTKEMDLEGKFSYDYSNLLFGSNGKCAAAMKSRYFDKFEEITRIPIMDAVVDKLMQNVKHFHIATPVENYYYKYE